MEENKYLEIFRKHWFKFVFTFMVVITAAIWGEKLLKSNKSHSNQDFATVSQLVNQFHKGEHFSLEAIGSLENILYRHPELHPKCDAMLATIFYSQQNFIKASDYAKAAFEHAKKNISPVYQQYMSATLLITEKKYKEALADANKLQSEIKNVAEYETLSGFNMVRILFLTEVLGQNDLKEQTWKEFKNHPSFQTLSSLFQEGSVGLTDYFK